MFITDKLIYIQMNKTACTHIASLLSKHIGGKQIGKHNWLEHYDTEKFICGSIRNPWEWYISLWAFGCKGEGTFKGRVNVIDTEKFKKFFIHKLQKKYGQSKPFIISGKCLIPCLDFWHLYSIIKS